jgi:hypothetical protein
VDPIVARAATSLVSSLVSALGRPLARGAVNAVLGTPEQRALNKACRTAVERVVEEAGATGMTDDEVKHALALVERLVQARQPDGVPVLDVEAESIPAAVLSWREAANDIGLDASTFPQGFDRIVEGLLRSIPDECRKAAKRPSNPLFAHVVIANLERLHAEVVAISQLIGDHRLTRLVPIAGDLRHALNDARLKCRMADRAFYTPDVLLALLEMPEGRVTRCFEAVRNGLGQEIDLRLRGYAAGLTRDAAGPYVDFDWTERDDVRRAQQLAWQDGASTVNDAYLLLGVLDTPSNTQRQLANLLGSDSERLRDAVLRLRKEPGRSGTPGTILEETSGL